MTQFWRHPKFSILFDYARRVAAKTVRFAPFMTRRCNGSIWLGSREKYSRILAYRSTVPTPSWVRRKRAWFIQKKSGYSRFEIIWVPGNFQLRAHFVYVSSRNIPPSSAQFFLRLFVQNFASSTKFFYAPTRTTSPPPTFFQQFLRHRTPNFQTPNRALLFPFRVGIRVRVRVRVFPEH